MGDRAAEELAREREVPRDERLLRPGAQHPGERKAGEPHALAEAAQADNRQPGDVLVPRSGEDRVRGPCGLPETRLLEAAQAPDRE